MKRSTERILTTFVGSLGRPADLLEMMRAKESDQLYDHEAFPARVRRAVAEVVHKQAEAGGHRGRWGAGEVRLRQLCERTSHRLRTESDETQRGPMGRIKRR